MAVGKAPTRSSKRPAASVPAASVATDLALSENCPFENVADDSGDSEYVH